MLRRPFAVGAAGGGFSSLLLSVLTDLADRPFDSSSVSSALDCVCPTLLSNNNLDIDLRSCLLGILIGLALGPLLEALVLLRHYWGNLVRRRFLSLSRSGGPLFRVL